ncbi:unnamed protein product [Mortierella alpina]
MTYYQNNMFNHLIQSDVGQGSGIDDDDSDNAMSTSSGTNTQQTYSWSNYSLPQLRELLRQRGQLTTGSKNALKKRLKNWIAPSNLKVLPNRPPPLTFPVSFLMPRTLIPLEGMDQQRVTIPPAGQKARTRCGPGSPRGLTVSQPTLQISSTVEELH